MRSLTFPGGGLPALARRPSRADDPRRELTLGAAVVGGFLAVGVVWAALAPLDAAVYAPGSVKVSGERQKVQTLHEGIVSALDVGEGQTVQRGQVLMRFATADVLAAERGYAAQTIGLQAQIARLQAQLKREAGFAEPAEFAAYRGDDRVLADRAMAMERSALATERSTQDAARAVLHQRIRQIGDQIDGYSVRAGSIRTQRALLGNELDGVRTLVAKGFAGKMRLFQLEREAADLDGSIGSVSTESARLRSAEGETRLQILQTDGERFDAASAALREAQTRLQTLLPQWTAARDQLARTEVRAPVAGTVVGLSVHNVGAVAANGQTLMEIVPKRPELAIEGRVAAQDVNQIFPGQTARVRISALHGRNVPELTGRITRVSADSFTDERTGLSFYTVSVSVPQAELQRLRADVGRPGTLRPGNPVQILVTLRPRSALQYWFEPLTQTLSGSLHES